ncbi:MAG: MBL fold metallo-hydrolase [Candidatus Eisenbacteria bacterium]|nr:MBL fold metallo-hydrolase [Candidatus Eisenbacteria bacterium]
MHLKHFFVEKIAHSSYLIGGRRTCAIVDPERNVDAYMDAARDLGLRITHIIETHLHADFVSGHIDLHERTGAAIYAPRKARCEFDHNPVSEGDSIHIEDVRLDVLETPGHTPEHVSYVASDTARSAKPVCVFTGDTLFVGDVGRPDLFPGVAQDLASTLHGSLHQKLLKLPDYCEVLPAHGAGSLCGRSMGAKWTSTIGYERRFNPALRIRSIDRFVESLTVDMPPTPDHFSRCSEINRQGPESLSELSVPVPLEPVAFREKVASGGAIVIDVRAYDAYGAQHVPGSLSIPLEGNFPTFAGWVIPEGARILVVADDESEVASAVNWLRRVGLEREEAYLDGGMFAWSKAGLEASHVPQLSAGELADMLNGRDALTLLDVRAATEYAGSHIEGSINIPAPDLRTRHDEIDSRATVVTMCSSGQRSSTAASILERQGFRSLLNVSGGYTGYAAAGFSEECTVCALPHGPRMVEARLGERRP